MARARELTSDASLAWAKARVEPRINSPEKSVDVAKEKRLDISMGSKGSIVYGCR
jgi:hypothetical protein